ncbi:hypothetical protein LNKW23_37560 [Paralimibaculum aggregatum]|uniref:Ysc84 actin-binding domain-containing protein n=2 Tax=Paralimibaculum aggregatum TaxID=3036245 RepID=A0ABQ6LMW6_9RHOB|nr:hypothetical protein LNKW23_37560 [Limibaculum sp. NKW23]
MTRFTSALALAAALPFLLPAQGLAQGEGGDAPQAEASVEDLAGEGMATVKAATDAVARLNERPRFAELAKRAKAIVIFPDVVKAGFLISGQFGSGVLLVKQADGTWSAPAFYGIQAAGIGLQAGAELSTLGLAVMTDEALAAFYDGGFKLGGGLDLTLAALGGTAELDTAADIVSFSVAKGAFAGLSLEGSNFVADGPRNAAYYGRDAMTTEEVAGEPGLTSPEITALHEALKSL